MTRAGKFAREYLRRDWLEIVLTVFGALFLLAAALCVLCLVILVVNFTDKDPGVPVGEGLLQVSKGYGIAVFGMGSIVGFLVGWALAGESIRNGLRALRGHRGDR